MQHADAKVMRATWEIYEPSFVLSVDSVIFAASFGVVVWLLFQGIWSLGAYFFGVGVAASEADTSMRWLYCVGV